MLVARRTFDPAEDLYLVTTRWAATSRAPTRTLPALAMMPMTMSLEILAEAASALMPGPDRDRIARRARRPLDRVRGRAAGPAKSRPDAGRAKATRCAVQLRNLTEDERTGDRRRTL